MSATELRTTGMGDHTRVVVLRNGRFDTRHRKRGTPPNTHPMITRENTPSPTPKMTPILADVTRKTQRRPTCALASETTVPRSSVLI